MAGDHKIIIFFFQMFFSSLHTEKKGKSIGKKNLSIVLSHLINKDDCLAQFTPFFWWARGLYKSLQIDTTKHS